MRTDREEQHLVPGMPVGPILHTGYFSHPVHRVELPTQIVRRIAFRTVSSHLFSFVVPVFFLF